MTFGSSEEVDAAHRLYCSSPKSVLYYCREDRREGDSLLRAYKEFADKSGLYSRRDGGFRFHFLCASLLGDPGSVFADVVKKYQGLVVPFKSLISEAKALRPPNEGSDGLGDFKQLWEERFPLLGKAQEIARIRFRLPEYSILLLRGLSGKFGMCCMVHDKYVFVNAQKGQDSFMVEATFHEMLHQLLLGYRCETEGRFFTGHLFWHPRRMMVEEIVLPCLQMELCEGSKERSEGRETVLHLDKSRPFLRPFKSLFSKVLRDWEEEYMRSRGANLQAFVDQMTRRHLRLHKFMLSMRQMSESVEKNRRVLGGK